MTQGFCTEKILLTHLERLKTLKERYDQEILLVEDGDSSYRIQNPQSAPAKLKAMYDN